MVTSTDDSPSETSGSGIPVIGSRPTTAPMLTTACKTIQMVMADTVRRPKVSCALRATRSPA